MPSRAGARLTGSCASQMSAWAVLLPHMFGSDVEARSERVEDAAEGGCRLEHLGMACRVRHRPETAHREPGHDTIVTGLPVPLQKLAHLGQVERLPHGRATLATVPPVGVEAQLPGLGHDHEQVELDVRSATSVSRVQLV